jgi:AmiR/NasT family two-component response regulator
LGALNMFRITSGQLNADDIAVAQALADVATIAILHHRAASEAQLVNEQLTLALNSRIVIEQAKGVLAERTGLDMDHAFARLRKYARDHNLRLVDVAHGVVEGTVKVEMLGPPPS